MPKKQKTLDQEFSFQDQTKQEMVDQLNEEFPVSLKHNEDLLNRVCARYPLLSQGEVGIIIQAVFSSFRDLLVLGKVLNLNSLFFDTKLKFYGQKRKGVIYPVLRVQVGTPPKLKKKESNE
jgi:hypothetical protein